MEADAINEYGAILTIEAAMTRIAKLETTLRQIADSGNSMNAHLARSVLENEHEGS